MAEAALRDVYGNRELTDVVLRVGETCRAAHRVVLATVSPYLRKMFGSGMAESKSREIELQGVSELALPALVEFSYTGKIVWSTVVAIIQAANHLQMEAVERAALDFLVEGLDAGNVLSALAAWRTPAGGGCWAGAAAQKPRVAAQEVCGGCVGAFLPAAAGGGGCAGDRVG